MPRQFNNVSHGNPYLILTQNIASNAVIKLSHKCGKVLQIVHLSHETDVIIVTCIRSSIILYCVLKVHNI